MADIIGLLAGVEAGDRVACAALADALEDAGGAEAAAEARELGRGSGPIHLAPVVAIGFEEEARRLGLIP